MDAPLADEASSYFERGPSFLYRWYRVLKKLERRMDASRDAAALQEVRVDLDRIGEEIRLALVPARYASSLFALRAHHQQLVSRIENLETTRTDA